jgi:hypothetical protein
MASVVKIKRSSIQGKAPTTSDITTGEIAINLRDQKLYSSNGSVVFEIGANNTTSHIGTLTVGNSSPYTFPTSDGSENFVLSTDGSGTLSFVSVATVSNTATFDETIQAGNTTSREISVGGLTVGSVTYPNTDGNEGQILSTDGNGNLTFINQSSALDSLGYTNSTITSDTLFLEDNVDLGNLTEAVIDAFGVYIDGEVLDCMEPIREIRTQDFGVLA